jgi:hypothetical protein
MNEPLMPAVNNLAIVFYSAFLGPVKNLAILMASLGRHRRACLAL